MPMLNVINNGCNGESQLAVTNVLLLDKPVTIPTIVEKNEPAHRGHAVKKPVNHSTYSSKTCAIFNCFF